MGQRIKELLLQLDLKLTLIYRQLVKGRVGENPGNEERGCKGTRSNVRDYVGGNFKDFNIMDFLGNGECKRVKYVDIRGHNGTNLTAPFWQG
ncbi:unnamed protein product [Porites evermanni]|uniref:Uncharacterized protein n=1 Tax=Porites evermanni TaxID=104178 RepID=A0ABN8NEL0_9CNID|nr:unnamed protein product [Porites evermanni]